MAVDLLSFIPFLCQLATYSSLELYCIHLVLQRGGLDVCLA